MKARAVLAGFVAWASLLVAGDAAAQSRIAIVPFTPAAGGGGAASDMGSGIADSLTFELHDGAVLDVVPKEKLLAAIQNEPGAAPEKPLSPDQALRVGKSLGAAFVVYGMFLKSGEAVQVNCQIGFVGTGKTYKLKAKGGSLFEAQDQLAVQVRKTILEGPEAAGAQLLGGAIPVKKAAAPLQPLEEEKTDPIAEKIQRMTFEERQRAAKEEFNKGAQIGNDSQEERMHYEIAIRYDPKYPRPRLNLGIIAYKKGEWAVAVEHFRKFVELVPEDPDAPAIRNYIADAERRLAQEVMKEVKVGFVPTDEQKSWSAADWFNKALEIMDKQPGLAIEYLKQAVQIDPNMAQAYYNLGKLHYDRNELEPAAKNFK
ncbi:MAG: tetratricopeptide repeat protein, partial [Bdellovibrionota bacterium]